MLPDRVHLERLISELDTIRQSAYWLEGELESWLSKVSEGQREGARNLIHYLALRRRDMRPLQDELATLGLSSLGRAEAHVLGTVEGVLAVLHRLVDREFTPEEDGVRPVKHSVGVSRLAANTLALFGTPAESGAGNGDDAVRIMVTMPTQAAKNYEFVEELVRKGMDCMRINCSHDTVAEWSAMIGHLERAREATGRPCRIFMDLGGPKVRTGPVVSGPQVVRWEPKRDAIGSIVRPARIWLTPQERPEPSPPGTSAKIPLEGALLERLVTGDRLSFKDMRGRSRTITLVQGLGVSWIAECAQTTYLGAECEMSIRPVKKDRTERDLPKTIFPSAIPPRELHLQFRAGDTFVITTGPTVARPIERDRLGGLIEEPRISCALPEALAHAEPGQSIFFDDGKIGGVILSVTPEELRVQVTHPVIGMKKLRASKGINLPVTHLTLPALTEKDLEDLDFVAEHADIVGLSFVNRTGDVEELQRQISRRTSRRIGIVLKIETRRGFDQLPRLLLAAMRTEPVGVMIARGDLAVECGYERMAEVQEEILWICEAAHVPAIWATEVLDRLSKKGQPTRAEISDAALGERAECVMLNKGPYVAESLRVLRGILGRMHHHQSKKSEMLRSLHVSMLPDPED